MTGFHRKYACFGGGQARMLPRLWLFTDERIGRPALMAAAARLPRGAGIILRHYSLPLAERRALFDGLHAIARRRGLALLLAGTTAQAAAWGADGWHGRSPCRSRRRRLWAGRIPPIHSAPAHDARELHAARMAGADMIFLSPLFPTRSHPGAPALGPVRFALLARQAKGMAVMALGGMSTARGRRIGALGAHGWGAIDGLAERPRKARKTAEG